MHLDKVMAYHTVKVGNNQGEIFFDNQDRQAYIKLLGHYKARLRFRLFGYVLLPDHVHLLIEPGPVELPRIMHSLHGAYARYFNQRYNRSGHLFQGRYLAGPCTGPGQLWELLRWLHFHPLRAGLSASAARFPWSSHQEYLGTQPDPVTDHKAVLLTLDSDLEVGRNIYRDIMERRVEPEQRLRWEGVLVEGAVAREEISVADQSQPSLPTLVQEVARVTNTTVDQICGPTRRGPVVWARGLISFLALRLGAWTAAEVGRTLAKHPATIIRGAERVESELDTATRDLVYKLWKDLANIRASGTG